MDQHSVILVKDVSHINDTDMENMLHAIACKLTDNLHMEAMIRVRVGYGNFVNQLP